MALAATLLILFPLTAHGASEDTVVPLDKLVSVHHEQTWDELIAPQLAERDRQNEEKKQKELAAQAAKVAQQARQATINAAPVTVELNDSKLFIYMMESGNRTNAINASSGACGLGQALPCSKLPCSLSDYACQDAWFTNYAMARYGSWDNAAAFWRANRWW